MISGLWIGLAVAWCAVVGDVVAETAAGPRGLIGFGAVLAEPRRDATVWIVAALAASAALALSWAIGSVRFHRRERRLAAQLDARFERLAADEASLAATRERLTGRLATLHRRIEELAHERQEIEDALSRERRRAAELHTLSIRTARELEHATREIEAGDVVELPEVATPTNRGATTEVPEARS